MKNKKRQTYQSTNLSPSSERVFQVITPFANVENPPDFFDDCPICQDMKRAVEAGELEVVENEWRN